ncbi:TetR/AcrR family transcriptional regulator [Ilyomonas limi]|uniref:TetR/AcrR family transcriptional regulator n=1 Tax=Ilyomonas limi TaxID=2575867 RepID=A0A4U3KSX5_9BACT|nr:TetR/AcrR family transcriptional regulator [Ilyomonas limi]TKK65402.1 TetR/AcrR family transcriptional regulator [Ilyomonas limi]
MASKDRIQKLKDDTRCNILAASLNIVKEEGWSSLSMRKIADKIDYTAPIIYEYFNNKEALLKELTRIGYIKLANEIEEARDKFTDAAEQLEAMWMAYWNFAFKEKELYQIMFGIEANCCVGNPCSEVQRASNLLWDKIEEIVPADKRTEEYIDTKYYTFWSVVHGLVSINMTRQLAAGNNEQQWGKDINKQVLKDALEGIISSIRR